MARLNWYADTWTRSGEVPPLDVKAWYDDWEVTGRDDDGNAILRYRPTGGLYRILPLEELVRPVRRRLAAAARQLRVRPRAGD